MKIVALVVLLAAAGCTTPDAIGPDPVGRSATASSASASTVTQAIALTPAPVNVTGEVSIATFGLTLAAGDVVFVDLSMVAGLPQGATLTHADLQLVVDGTPQPSGHVTLHDAGTTGTCTTSYVATSPGLHSFAVNGYAIASDVVTLGSLNVRALVLSPR